jgi:hypothetical protein
VPFKIVIPEKTTEQDTKNQTDVVVVPVEEFDSATYYKSLITLDTDSCP